MTDQSETAAARADVLSIEWTMAGAQTVRENAPHMPSNEFNELSDTTSPYIAIGEFLSNQLNNQTNEQTKMAMHRLEVPRNAANALIGFLYTHSDFSGFFAACETRSRCSGESRIIQAGTRLFDEV